MTACRVAQPPSLSLERARVSRRRRRADVTGIRQTRGMPKPASTARLRAARLDAHGLRTGLPSIAAAVRRLGAVQAQDFAAARWVLGARVPGSVSADVDAAIESREVVRSWPMRGTLHLLPDRDAAADPRDHRATHHAARGHAPSATRTRSRRVHPRPRARRSRAGRRRLALPRGALRRRGSRRASERPGSAAYHLIWWLAPRTPWSAAAPSRVAGSASCCSTSGRRRPVRRPRPRRDAREPRSSRTPPATARSPCATSPGGRGLTLTDARTALAAAGDAVAAFDDEHVVAADAGWAADPASTTPRTSRRLALAAFDEYFLGYTDRGDVCDPLPRAEGRARPERGVPADPRERRRRRRGRSGRSPGRRARHPSHSTASIGRSTRRTTSPPSRGGRGSTASELGAITTAT